MKRFEKFLGLFDALGVVLLFASFAFPALQLSHFLIAYAVLGFLLFPTYALKIFRKADTFYVLSLLKTKRVIGFIERVSKPGLWDLLADFGLVLGFGTIAVDYLVARKKSFLKRILIACLSSIALFTLFFLVFGSVFGASNPELIPLLTLFSIAFAFGGLMLFTIVSLAWQAVDIFSKLMIGKVPCPGVAPIIPGIQMPNLPRFLTPPLYVWGAFLIILVVHEFSHGALMKRTKVKIKSVGIALAGLLPIGAFVEPDETQIKSKSERQQLRIYAIGPGANIYSIAVFLAIFALVSAATLPVLGPMVDSMEKEIEIESIAITGILEDYEICGNRFEIPAQGLIEEGWILRKHNGIELKTLYDFSKAFSKPDKNVSMVFETAEGKPVEISLEKNVRGEIGIKTEISYVAGKEPTQQYKNLVLLTSSLLIFFGWLLLLSFALATINFLPMAPFDGGKIAKIVFLPYFGFLKMSKRETQKFIGRLMLWIVVGLLLLNALPLFL